MEECTKHNKPIDCINCTRRTSLTANLTSMHIECDLGKFDFNIGINSISSIMITEGKDVHTKF